jgi:hypothetical protein
LLVRVASQAFLSRGTTRITGYLQAPISKMKKKIQLYKKENWIPL